MCMADNNSCTKEFGCLQCWPEDADHAWAARTALTPESELVGESHYGVVVMRCGACAQRFVSVFAELIDWDDGDDSQLFALMPISREEIRSLSPSPGGLELMRLGAGRKCLYRSHPKGGTGTTGWGRGLLIPPHD